MHLFHIVWFCVEHVIKYRTINFRATIPKHQARPIFFNIYYELETITLKGLKNPTSIVRVHLLTITNLCMNEKKVNPKPERV